MQESNKPNFKENKMIIDNFLKIHIINTKYKEIPGFFNLLAKFGWAKHAKWEV